LHKTICDEREGGREKTSIGWRAVTDVERLSGEYSFGEKKRKTTIYCGDTIAGEEEILL